MAIAAAHRHSSLRDLGLFVARIVLGVVFAAHGYQKVAQMGVGAVSDMFAGMGIPLPQIAGPFVAWLELVGGILLILGAFTPIVGVALAIDMLVAAILVHASKGLFIDGGGWELVGALGAGALALAAAGAGRFSLDHAILGRRRTARTATTAPADAESGSSRVA